MFVFGLTSRYHANDYLIMIINLNIWHAQNRFASEFYSIRLIIIISSNASIVFGVLTTWISKIVAKIVQCVYMCQCRTSHASKESVFSGRAIVRALPRLFSFESQIFLTALSFLQWELSRRARSLLTWRWYVYINMILMDWLHQYRLSRLLLFPFRSIQNH